MEEKNDWIADKNGEEDKKNIQLGDIYCCTSEFDFESYEVIVSSESRVSLLLNNKFIMPLELKFLNDVIFMISYEFGDQPLDKSKLKSIIIDAVDSKDKDNSIRITNLDLSFEIPKSFKTLHRFSEFHVGYNKFDQTFMIYLYLYNNVYIIKLNFPKKKFEILYEKKIASSPNSNSSLMLNYLTNNEDSRVFLYNKPNLIILTYNYFKNLNYEEKLLNLESINDKIKNIYISNFDLKNVFIITHLSSLFYFDYKSNKMSKVEDKYKFLCENIHLISNLTSDDPTNTNYQYFITNHRDKDKKIFYLKLWRMNLNVEVCEKTSMLKIEFIQQIQFDFFNNADFDYKLKINDRKIMINFFDHDKLFILNIAEHDKIFVFEKIYQFNSDNCSFTLTTSEINLSIKPEGVCLNLFIYFSNEMISLYYNKITQAKFLNFIKCLSPSDFKKDSQSLDTSKKSDKNKKSETVNAFNTNKIDYTNDVSSEKISNEIKLPEKKNEEIKKVENKKERKNLPMSLNDDPKQPKEVTVIEKNFPIKNDNKIREERGSKKEKQNHPVKQIYTKEKQRIQREEGSGSIKKINKSDKNEIEKSSTNDLKDKESVSLNERKESKIELFDLNEIKLLLENKIKPSIENKMKEEIDQILDKNLSVFSENINKKFSEILNIFNREKEILENRKKINLDLLENISKLVLKNSQNSQSIQTSNIVPSPVQNDHNVNQQSTNEIKIETIKQNNQIPQPINIQKTQITTPNHNLNSNNNLNNNLINSNLYNQNFSNNVQSGFNNFTNLPLNSSTLDMNLLLYYLNNQHRALQQQLSMNTQILSSFQQSQGININPLFHPSNYNISATPNNPLINQYQQPTNRTFNQSIPSNIPYLAQNLNNNNNSYNPYFNSNFNTFNSSNQSQMINNPFNNFQFTTPNNNIANSQNQFIQGVSVNQNPVAQNLAQTSPKKISTNQINSNSVSTKVKELEKISLDIESEEDDLSPEEEEKFINMIKEDLKTKGKKKKIVNSQVNSISSHGRLRNKKPKKK